MRKRQPKATQPEDSLVAYPPTMAAALTGATVAQLRHWRNATTRTGPLLTPEISSESRIILYSFRDLLALRTFVQLRQTASLQRIRKAVNSLRDFGQAEHLAAYSLVSDQSGNVRLVTAEEEMELARSPGQLLLIAEMAAIIEPFAVQGRPGVVIPDLFRPRAHLTVDPETQAGIPVIAGTRVPYDVVASLMREDEVPAEKISEYYPTVTPEAARDALDFARYVDSYGPTSRAA
jgi:uncharacterized protein (DUF433 family)/DNA-binding transcriptional MerR regulator